MITHEGLRRCLVLAALVASTACTGVPAHRLADAAPGPVGPETYLSDRLFFGRRVPGGGQVPDSSWARFLEAVVTPLFPAGLTVWQAEGQWLDPPGELVREPVMVVEALHPRGTPADPVFDRIATEYMRRFNQDAVLRSTAETRTRLYAVPPR